MGGRWVYCRVVFWTGSGFRAGGALRGGGREGAGVDLCFLVVLAGF